MTGGGSIDTEDEQFTGGQASPSSANRTNNGQWIKKRDELQAKLESLRDCRRAAYILNNSSHACKEQEKAPLDLRIEDFICMQLANTP